MNKATVDTSTKTRRMLVPIKKARNRLTIYDSVDL